MTYIKIPQLKRWDVDKFWYNDNFIYRAETGCLEWQRGLNIHGYGRIGFGQITYPVHRIAYYIYYGEDPGELLVRHICHNRICANPFHLTLGTHWDNSQDMVEAGRSQKGDAHWMKRRPDLLDEWRKTATGKLNLPENGEGHPCTKLTEDKVRQIKMRSAAGIGNKALAKEFGVSHSNISAIVLGKSWAHVKVKVRPKENKWGTKLTEEMVRDIRQQVANGRSVNSIAVELGYSPTTIDNVVKRVTWKHIE